MATKKSPPVPDDLNKRYQLHDALEAERIVVVARKIDNAKTVKGSSKDQTNRAVAKNQALAWISKPWRLPPSDGTPD